MSTDRRAGGPDDLALSNPLCTCHELFGTAGDRRAAVGHPEFARAIGDDRSYLAATVWVLHEIELTWKDWVHWARPQ